jgi:hypothetical protein
VIPRGVVSRFQIVAVDAAEPTNRLIDVAVEPVFGVTVTNVTANGLNVNGAVSIDPGAILVAFV